MKPLSRGVRSASMKLPAYLIMLHTIVVLAACSDTPGTANRPDFGTNSRTDWCDLISESSL